MLQVVRCHHFATLSPPSTWPLGAALVSVFVSSTCFFEFLVANVGVIPGYPGLPELNFLAKHPLGPWRLLAITGASPRVAAATAIVATTSPFFFSVALARQKVGENIGYHVTKGTNLVGGAITILKNMSSSMGRMTSHI